MAREMKDSGIEWIGKIPTDWEVKRNKGLFYEVNERCDNGSEHTLLSVSEYTGIMPRSEFTDEGSFETRAESLDGYKLCETGDIVMNIMLAWKRATARSDYDGIVSPAYCVYRGINVNTKYYHYLYRTDGCANMFKRFSTGIIDSRLRLYPDVFLSLSSVVPSIEEQNSISGFLDAECFRIDSLIKQTRTSIEEYKKLKQAIITQVVTQGIRPGRQMKDSGVEWIGVVAEDYQCRKLKTFSDIISKGSTPKDIMDEINDDYCIRYIKSENIVENELQGKPEFGIQLEIHEGELKRSRLTKRDILFVIAGASIGKTAIMKETMIPSNTNQATSFIRIKSEYLFCQKYLWYVLQSEIVKRYISIFAVQSAQPNLSMADLGDVKIPFPNDQQEVLDLIDYLDNEFAKINKCIEMKEQLLTELNDYRQSLIYEYVTGKKEAPVC